MTWRGGVATVVGVHPTWCCTSPLKALHAGLGEGVGDCRVAALSKRCSFWFLWSTCGGRTPCSVTKNMLLIGFKLLNILVSNEEPAFGHRDDWEKLRANQLQNHIFSLESVCLFG